MRLFIVFAVCFTAISAAPQPINQDVSQRVVGGSVTTINQYPSMAALLSAATGVTFTQSCGGSIINNRSILTAAHCLEYRPVNNIRCRLGSSWANSGGVVYNINFYIIHANYNSWTMDSDIAILRTTSIINFSNVVVAASIAGANYIIGDNSVVWAAGWGPEWYGGPPSEQLRHVQIWTVNQYTCAQLYAGLRTITNNMLCSGWLNVGGRGQCQMDSGGPLYHNGIIIGVYSYANGCGLPNHPSVNVRVPNFTPWIQANA